MSIEKLMENLRNEIGKEIYRLNCPMTEFASKCCISYECLCGIVYKKTKNVGLDTIIKICENSKISYTNLFDCSDDEIFEKMIEHFSFTDGNKKYKLNKY